MHATGMALFPIPVALYIAWGKPRRAAMLLALAAAAPLTAAQGAPEGAQTAVRFLLAAGAGVPLGVGLSRRWPYGWTLAATAAYAAVLLGSVLALHHEAWRVGAEDTLTAFEDAVARQAERANPEPARRFQESLAWMRRHWVSIGYGLAFVQTMLAAAVFQWATVRLLRTRKREAGPPNPFRSVRLPDWLVWAVIGCAALWFLDHYRDVSWARHVSWNGLIGLSALYWLNGLAVAVHAVALWRPGPLAAAAMAAVVLLALSAVHATLILVGLFDTWGDFRRKADRIAAARQQDGPGGDSPR